MPHAAAGNGFVDAEEFQRGYRTLIPSATDDEVRAEFKWLDPEVRGSGPGLLHIGVQGSSPEVTQEWLDLRGHTGARAAGLLGDGRTAAG